jgi:BRO1-like domain
VPLEEETLICLVPRPVLAGIVALLTDRIADCSVTDREACKRAVGMCQTAVGLFQMLKELVQSQDFHTVDMCQANLEFWEKYLLAQAQNLVYRMASLASDGDAKHGTLAVLAMASYRLFADALSASQDPRLQSEITAQAEEWGSYCKVVSMLQAAKAAYHQSVVHRVSCQWGLEIARLKEGLAKLEACRDFCKTLNPDGVTGYTRRECLAILPVVRDRLHEADQDNYKIYQDEVPKDLPEVPSKQLAKPSALPQSMLVPSRPMFVGL